jgi:hypothetical protein
MHHRWMKKKSSAGKTRLDKYWYDYEHNSLPIYSNRTKSTKEPPKASRLVIPYPDHPLFSKNFFPLKSSVEGSNPREG